MKKTLGRLSLILLCCSFSALLAFRLIESWVDSKGVLREPFFLLPISLLRLVRESPPELDLLPGVKPRSGANHWLSEVAWRRHPCSPPGYF